MRRQLLLFGFVLLLASGCVIEGVDLSGKPCPCAAGWWCDPSTKVCVRGSPDDAGLDAVPDIGRDAPLEAGRDASLEDGDAADAAADAPAGDDAPWDAAAPDAVEAGPDARDAGPDAPPTLDDTACDDVLAGRLFCDGFQDQALAAWPMRNEQSGTAARTMAPAYRGGYALRATTTTTAGKAAVRTNFPGPRTSGDLYVRAYVYVPSNFSIVSLSILYVGEPQSPYQGVSFQVVSDDQAQVWTDTGYVALAPAAARMPKDRWTCVQFHVVISHTAGMMELWLDGTKLGSLGSIDTLPASGFEVLSAGLDWTHGTQEPATVYLDEVALDTSPIPCD